MKFLGRATAIRYSALSLAVCSVFLPASATAGNVYDGAVHKAVIEANRSITQAITTMHSQLLSAIRELKTVTDANGTKVAETITQSADNAVQRNIDTQQQMRKNEIERNTQLPIDPCANGAMGMTEPNFGRLRPGAGRGAITGPRSGGSLAGPSTGSSKLDAAIDIAKGFKPAPSPEVQAMMAQAGACTVYAGNDVRRKACEAAGTPPQTVKFPDADIEASTLFDGAQSAANSGRVDKTFSKEQLAAVDAYLRNLSNPVVLHDLTEVELKTDAGRQYMALNDALKSRLDLANRPGENWRSHAAPYKATIAVVKAMLDGNGAAAEYLKERMGQMPADWNTEGISIHQLMEIETERRCRNPKWQEEIAKASDPMTLAREQLSIAALQTDLMTQQLLETRTMNVILGSIYQASLNKDFMPEVLAAHRKATSTR